MTRGARDGQPKECSHASTHDSPGGSATDRARHPARPWRCEDGRPHAPSGSARWHAAGGEDPRRSVTGDDATRPVRAAYAFPGEPSSAGGAEPAGSQTVTDAGGGPQQSGDRPRTEACREHGQEQSLGLLPLDRGPQSNPGRPLRLHRRHRLAAAWGNSGGEGTSGRLGNAAGYHVRG